MLDASGRGAYTARSSRDGLCVRGATARRRETAELEYPERATAFYRFDGLYVIAEATGQPDPELKWS